MRLVADLIDGALVAPGARFSFNETTGERNAAKGFEEAPVIINGELESGIGGGVCQVSTTLFNAAFEAGLSIDKRTNHALYIDHYPLGRDATVNYPDIDLVFTNDTDKWLLVRTFVGAGSLTVNIYGTPQHRRVETETAPLAVDGKVPWKRIDDDTMYKGQKVVEQWGAPPRTTSVTRRVYKPDGTPLYDTTWHSYYVGEPTVVRIGTRPRAKPKPEPAKPPVTGTQTDGTATEPATPPALPRAPRRRLGPEDVLDEPGRHPRRPMRSGVHGRVGRPPVGDALPLALDEVLVPETRAADLRTAHTDGEHVVECGGPLVLEVDAGRERLDAAVADRLVAARERCQVRDASLLEPDRRRMRGGRCPARRSRRSARGPGGRGGSRPSLARYTPTLGCPTWEPPRSSRR